MTHPDDARLNDYVDDRLDPAGAAAMGTHLAGCPGCRGRVEALRRLDARLRALPREIAPPHDLRPPVPAPGRTSTGAIDWRRAAAVVLAVAGAAALTWLGLVRPGAEPGMGPPVPGAAGGREAGAPIASYARAGRDLEAELTARRAASPEVVRLAARSLEAVDAAILDLERALEKDPGDRQLARMLEDRYRLRLELLRGAIAQIEEG